MQALVGNINLNQHPYRELTLVRVIWVSTQRKPVLYTREQLVVECLASSLQDIQCPASRRRIERVVDLGARHE